MSYEGIGRKPTPRAKPRPAPVQRLPSTAIASNKYLWLERIQDDPERPRSSTMSVAFALTRDINGKTAMAAGVAKTQTPIATIAALARVSPSVARAELKWLHDRGHLGFEPARDRYEVRVRVLRIAACPPATPVACPPATPVACPPATPVACPPATLTVEQKRPFAIERGFEPRNPAQGQPIDRRARQGDVEARPRRTSASPMPSGRFNEFWAVYPKRKGPDPRAPAEQLFDAAVAGGIDPGLIIAAAGKFALAERANAGTPYIPMARTWLADQRWFDHADEIATEAALDPMEKRRLAAIAMSAGNLG